MTAENENTLKHILNQGCTDSDVEDFCDATGVSRREAFHFISVLQAPECCKKCKFVDFYSAMFPCSQCSHPKMDYYSEGELTQEELNKLF